MMSAYLGLLLGELVDGVHAALVKCSRVKGLEDGIDLHHFTVHSADVETGRGWTGQDRTEQTNIW